MNMRFDIFQNQLLTFKIKTTQIQEGSFLGKILYTNIKGAALARSVNFFSTKVIGILCT